MEYRRDRDSVWKDEKGRIMDVDCLEYVEDGIVYEG